MEIVSIAAVLAAIEDAVSVPEHEVVRWRLADIPEKSHVLGIEINTFGFYGRSGYEECLRHWYRRSMAARLLDFALAEAVPEALTWRDARETGAFKKNSAARDQILPVLADLISHYEDCAKAHAAREISFSRPHAPPCRWMLLTDEWKNSIGFEKAEIGEFLDQYVAPHLPDSTSLFERCEANEERQPLEGPLTSPGNKQVHRISGNLPTSFDKLLKKHFQEALESLTSATIHKSEVRHYLFDITWASLRTLAEDRSKRPSFVQGIKDGSGIIYYNGDKTKYFSDDALQVRIKRALEQGSGLLGRSCFEFKQRTSAEYF